MKKELLKGLTEEQIAKLKECKNQEEMLAMAKEEGLELTDEQLESISGGCFTAESCPKCGSTDIERMISTHYFMGKLDSQERFKECQNCGYAWDFEPA